ncbi:hypothetical protein HQ545_01055 [Candidatus Woesearchaeota archaeon]|nr:hypothetical protein [Candidatus Woesearchaeota archaeon]
MNTLIALLLPPSEQKRTTVITIAVGRTTLTNTAERAWQQLLHRQEKNAKSENLQLTSTFIDRTDHLTYYVQA